jgi:[ribosomal protein S5]-alanine N-acetyltransferase
VRPFDLAAFKPPLRVPELAAGPIMLRPFTMSDLPLIREAATDPYIPTITSVPARYDEAGGRAFILRQIDRSDDGHGYPFVITESADPARGVGAIGLWLREIDSGRASIGYWVAPSARGRHLAGSALRAVVAFAFETLSIPRLHLFIEPWNVASQRTAEAAGFSQEALLRGWERVEGAQHDAYSYVLLHQERDGDPDRDLGRRSGRGSGRRGRGTIS